jgi:Flp pilus assembly pilin Flp
MAGGKTMDHLRTALWRIRHLCEEEKAQDLIEYALMAGFVAVSAGAIMPGVATSISKIFSKVGSVMSNAQVPT